MFRPKTSRRGHAAGRERRSGGVIQGVFVSNRQPQDQEIVKKLTDNFLQEAEKRVLTLLLGKERYEDIRFTAEEAQILTTRASIDFLQATNATPRAGAAGDDSGFPFLQLYDFILTIDDVMAHMRGLEVQVHNMEAMGEAANRAILERNIISDDYRPWAFVDATQGDAAAARGDLSVGTQIGDSHVVRLPEAKSPHALRSGERVETPTRVEMNLYEKSCVEAYLLDFALINAIVALGQGLFTVHVTNARRWGLSGDEDGEVREVRMTEDQIPIGSWINAFVPGLSFPQPGEGAQSMFAAKYTDIRDYPNNILGKLYARLDKHSSIVRLDEFNVAVGDPEWRQLRHLRHQTTGHGGAIGTRIFTVNDSPGTAGASVGYLPPSTGEKNSSGSYAEIPDTAHGPRATPSEADKKQKYPMWNFSIDALHQSLETMTYHPISACPRLAKAFNQAGIGQALFVLYRRLSTAFSTKRLTTSLGVTTADPLQLLANRGRGTELANAFVCPPGMHTMYRDSKGQMIPPKEAILEEKNGQRFYAPHVDPNRTECVAKIAVPDTKESQRVMQLHREAEKRQRAEDEAAEQQADRLARDQVMRRNRHLSWPGPTVRGDVAPPPITEPVRAVGPQPPATGPVANPFRGGMFTRPAFGGVSFPEAKPSSGGPSSDVPDLPDYDPDLAMTVPAETAVAAGDTGLRHLEAREKFQAALVSASRPQPQPQSQLRRTTATSRAPTRTGLRDHRGRLVFLGPDGGMFVWVMRQNPRRRVKVYLGPAQKTKLRQARL